MHFQRIIINECVLMNKDKYSYIAIFDTDELILPRNNNFLIPNLTSRDLGQVLLKLYLP